MKISKLKSNRNPDYIGYDEDHNGDWEDFFCCPECEENYYITVHDKYCNICQVDIEWID